MKDILVEIIYQDNMIAFSNGNIVPRIGEHLGIIRYGKTDLNLVVVDVRYVFYESALVKVTVLTK